MKKTALWILLLAGCASLMFGKPHKNIAIKGGKIYTITEGIIEGGVLLIESGKIKVVGQGIDVPEGFEIIDAAGKVITPGFVLAYSQVGLEGDLLAGDYLENSDPITPQMRAIDAFYPLSKSIPRLRNSGITTVAIFPSPGNVISGQGAILKPLGKVAEQMALKTEYGLLLTIGDKAKRTSGMPRTRMGEIYLLRKAFNDAKDYMKKWADYEKSGDEAKKPIRDFKMEPLVALLNGEYPAFIECFKMQDIMNAIKLSDDYGFKIVFVDAQQAYMAAGVIAEKNIPVLAVPLKSMVWDIEKRTWKPENARLLREAGVLTAIIGGDWPAYGNELTFFAAYAVRYGLSEEEALKAITIYPARILGLEHRLGSLEEGKDADILIMNGPPLSVKTRIEKVIIQGDLIEIFK